MKKKFPGVTEYIGKKTNTAGPVMLIYNEILGVSPLTTHTPLKNVAKYVKKEKTIYQHIPQNTFSLIQVNESQSFKELLGYDTFKPFIPRNNNLMKLTKLLITKMNIHGYRRRSGVKINCLMTLATNLKKVLISLQV